MAGAEPTSDPLPLEALRARRSRVVGLRSDLEAELEAIGESTASVPDDEHDPEGSTVGYERARVSALLARAQEEIEDLGAALQRVAGQTYGRCDLCGAPIGRERLAALPTATTCVACAAQTPSHRPTGASPNR